MKAFGSSLPVALALGISLLAGEAIAPARAGLGNTVASVQSDRVSMKGQLRARSEAGYAVEEITGANGTVVREYVSPAGVVFAVSWYGPAMPNLQQTFGGYFAQFQAAVQTRRAQQHHMRGHNHLEIHTPSLVVRAYGHMRQYFGVAYVPALMPANLSVSDLH
ncbi:MAG TPA: DUF2844 domain-containing protein [Steroidobacteraceae bacterium]|nr:DUF2844 domain-containing protein [Steroidobacteraceae bacterium]